MAKDRRIIHSPVIQCCAISHVYIGGLTDDGSLYFSLWISPSSLAHVISLAAWVALTGCEYSKEILNMPENSLNQKIVRTLYI